MTSRLIRIFLLALLIWSVACFLMWCIGITLYSYFNGFYYSLGWNDIKTIAKLTLVISASYTFIAWLNIHRS